MRTAAPSPTPTSRTRARLGLATGLGALTALWALVQWAELLLARAGQTPFCALGGTWNCAAVWDGAFAAFVHDVTRVPVAGWGLVWGAAATVLPLLALVDERRLARGGSAAIRLVAVAGLASVVCLAAASAAAGALCLTCLGTYVLVFAWSVAAWRATTGQRASQPARGLFVAGAVVLAGYLVVLYPGLRTPHAEKALALPKATERSPWDGPATGDATRDDLLEQFVGSLDPETRQVMSDLFARYEDAQPVELPPARAFAIGDGSEPVHITEWTDPLCPHCARLHATLAEIAQNVPPGLFSVESRQFPLDGACNPAVNRKSEDGLRCIAAEAQICLEGQPHEFEAVGKLFAQEHLTVDGVYETLAPYLPRATLEACVDAPATKEKLADDIRVALGLGIRGTPLVLLDGKQVAPYGPVLYALILTGGSPKNPAFAELPPPRPSPGPAN